jgi:hypothetical protein
MTTPDGVEEKEKQWAYSYHNRAFGPFISIWYGLNTVGSITVYNDKQKENVLAKLRQGGFVEYNEGESKRD